MKIAIIGSGPIAILTAFHFDQLGADVVLFQRAPLGGNLNLLKSVYPQYKIQYQNQSWELEKFYKEVLVAQGLELEKYNLTKHGDVLRVHKRFLHPTESIPNRSRMHDLFRVIYSTNPKESILKQLEENPEMFEKLGKDVIESLHKPVESFADFDIIIEASGAGSIPNPMGAGLSLALNENNLKDCGLIFYEKEIFEKLNLEKQKSITLIGENESAFLSLLKLKDWLLADKTRELHWVTYKETNENSFGQFKEEVGAFFSTIKSEFEKSKEVFEANIRKWRDLEDYEKVKVPKPVEPKAQITIHEGYDVTSIDKLLDREELYITIESPDFRVHALKGNDIITLASDNVLVCRGHQKLNLAQGSLLDKEAGYYKIELNDLNSVEEKILEVQNDILKYFSKAPNENN